MGHLNRFDINELKKKYNLNIFVETGTGLGSSLKHVLNFNFKQYYSIEISKILFDQVKKILLNNNNIKLINNESEKGLVDVINEIKSNENILFWLDAHFPEADFGITSYDSENNNNIRIPLESELKTLNKIRNLENDLIIIDDLRIYEDGNFTSGNWTRRKELGGNGIDFIYELFSKTHLIEKNYNDQGYILLKPKK